MIWRAKTGVQITRPTKHTREDSSRTATRPRRNVLAAGLLKSIGNEVEKVFKLTLPAYINQTIAPLSGLEAPSPLAKGYIMRKLKLDLGNLDVTSFEINEADAGRGTVEAHKTVPYTLGGVTCPTTPVSCGAVCLTTNDFENTCTPSCAGTCDTCAPSCNQYGSCDNAATCLEYLTCAYATCACDV